MSEFLADQVRVGGMAQPDPRAPADRLVRSVDPEVALRKAFPGIWIREDGAFRTEEFGVAWEPGDVEADAPDHPHAVRSIGGLCAFVGSDYGRGAPRLKLSQLWALTDYIEYVSAKIEGAHQ